MLPPAAGKIEVCKRWPEFGSQFAQGRAAAFPADLTTAQGTQICRDLAHWADSSAVNNADSVPP
jgi:hypothetical protein